MGGLIPGVGGSSTTTDRGNQLAGVQGSWGIFNQGMALGSAEQSSGDTTLASAQPFISQASQSLDSSSGTLANANTNLNSADQYYKSLLTGGRTSTAALAAPAVNAQLAQTDAQRNAQGTFGTGRTGGTAATNVAASTASTSKIDDIINQNLQAGRAQGAQGELNVAQGRTAIATGQQNVAAGKDSLASTETAIGGIQLQDALGQLNLSQNSINQIIDSSLASRTTDFNQQSAIGGAIGQIIVAALLA